MYRREEKSGPEKYEIFRTNGQYKSMDHFLVSQFN